MSASREQWKQRRQYARKNWGRARDSAWGLQTTFGWVSWGNNCSRFAHIYTHLVDDFIPSLTTDSNLYRFLHQTSRYNYAVELVGHPTGGLCNL